MIRVDNEADQIVIAKVYKAGQEQILRFWDELSFEQRNALLEQIRRVDFQELQSLGKLLSESKDQDHSPGKLDPPELIALPETDAEQAAHKRARDQGLEWLAAGQVAAFVVAGGQGTRLGWNQPKGTYPVGPVSQKPLFALFAEQVLAWNKRFRREIPWCVMTSVGNDATTRAFFDDQEYFGLPKTSVHFMVQRNLPVVDARGKILLTRKDRMAMSPDGHGGALFALQRSGVLEQLLAQGVKHLSYFQVDNPLCQILDPVFIGYHALRNSQASSKIVSKVDPMEKVGVLGLRNGQLSVIEYSELSDELRYARDEQGRLVYRAGSIANHVFCLNFLKELLESTHKLPYHLAHKKVPTVNKDGDSVPATEPNGYKFERFIFDTLPQAERSMIFEVAREEGFEPLKNADGANSPETVRAAMIERAARWLEYAGVEVERDAEGVATQVFEINAATATAPEELKDKVDEGWTPPAGQSQF